MGPISYRSQALKLVALQALVAVVFAAICWFVVKPLSGISALMGGAIAFVPNLYFAIRVFTRTGARNAQKILGDLFKAEAVKLILTGAMFAGIFIYYGQKIDALFLFIGFIVCQFTIWLAPLVTNIKK